MTPEEIDKIVSEYKFPFEVIKSDKMGIQIADQDMVLIDLVWNNPRTELLAKFIVEKLNHLST